MGPNRRRILWAFAVLAVVTLSAVAVMVLVNYENIVLDNRSHQRACADLPSAEAANDLLDRNEEVVRAIHGVAADADVRVVAESPGCPWGHVVEISYGSHDQRRAIEGVVAGTELEKAPINWRNR